MRGQVGVYRRWGRGGAPAGPATKRAALAGALPGQSLLPAVVYFTTTNGRIMSFSSCSRMWQWYTQLP